jgi:hypothetical protein
MVPVGGDLSAALPLLFLARPAAVAGSDQTAVEAMMLGPMHAESFDRDPKHLGFVLARYKFVAKMLAGADYVLEVGCGDCTGARVVKPCVMYLAGIDREIYAVGPSIPVYKHDMTAAPFRNLSPGGPYFRWNAIYSLDVLEHIAPELEDTFLANLCASSHNHATVLIGTPSLESQAYASPISKQHHVNCKTEDGLRTTLSRHFHNVFLFGMNDETLHTGFGAMCHYRLAICTGAYR